MNPPACLTRIRLSHWKYPNDRVCLSAGEVQDLLDYLYLTAGRPIPANSDRPAGEMISHEGLPLDHGAVDRINGFGG